jgi:phosphodiesterase/alkaline phosphatase D-like protein
MGRRAAAVAVAAILATVAVPTAAQAARGFSFGVSSAEVTSSSALLWARANSGGRYWAQIARDRAFRHVVASASVRALSSNNGTMQITARGLRPNTRFFYRFAGSGGRRSDTGQFRTAPSASQNATIHFGWSGDADAQRARGQTQPFYNTLGDRNFAVYGALARENNSFNVNLGDTIYSDSEVGATFVNGVYQGFAPALTVSAKWAKYRQNLALPNLQRLRTNAAMYNQWDDHEFINDFARGETLVGRTASGQVIQVPGSSVYGAGVRAFRNYMPVTYSSRNGIYRSFRWGKNLEVFFLDERSFRSPKAGSPTVHTCDNPQTNAPDLAPTAPQNVRSGFAAITPSLTQPVSQTCLNAINDPNRTMLGRRQLSTFERAIRRSTATFKVIMNEVPIQQFFALPYDRWEGYAAERAALLNFLRTNVKNVIFLTTDVHASLVNDARFRTFPAQGGPTNSGILDVTTGPVATMTFQREINSAVGNPSAGALVDSLFFDHSPTASSLPGVGMQCSVVNTFSYGEVTVTNRRLTVRLKDQNRRPVREEEGSHPACPAFVLNRH